MNEHGNVVRADNATAAQRTSLLDYDSFPHWRDTDPILPIQISRLALSRALLIESEATAERDFEARNNARAALNFLDKSSPDVAEVREALTCIVNDAD